MQRGVIAAFLAGAISWGQPAPARLSFEVASVKVNTTNGTSDFVPRRSGDRVTMHNADLSWLVVYAYHLTNVTYELVGSLEFPGTRNFYDVEAIAPGSPSDDDIRLMFQTLLEDRFKLRVHRETRELTRYDLIVAGSGLKLKAADPESKIASGTGFLGPGRGTIGCMSDGCHLTGKGVTMEKMVGDLIVGMHALVRDRTGLAGTFDYSVLFSWVDNPTDVTAPPPLTIALQQQLGLSLEKAKGPVEVLVIDHVEKPSEN